MAFRPFSRARRSWLAIGILLWAWPATADLREARAAANPFINAIDAPAFEPRASPDAANAISRVGGEFCTRIGCAPRPGDSPWTLAGFGGAALAAARLGRKPSPAQSPADSARG